MDRFTEINVEIDIDIDIELYTLQNIFITLSHTRSWQSYKGRKEHRATSVCYRARNRSSETWNNWPKTTQQRRRCARTKTRSFYLQLQCTLPLRGAASSPSTEKCPSVGTHLGTSPCTVLQENPAISLWSQEKWQSMPHNSLGWAFWGLEKTDWLLHNSQTQFLSTTNKGSWMSIKTAMMW